MHFELLKSENQSIYSNVKWFNSKRLVVTRFISSVKTCIEYLPDARNAAVAAAPVAGDV
jgi:hypothetical protein